MTAKRVFVGIKATNEITQNIRLWRESHTQLKQRWIPENNLHITLLPPWYENDLDTLKKRLRNIKLGIKPFFIYFTKITDGPDTKHPRLIWAVGKNSENLSLLIKNTEKHFPAKIKENSFIPHITLLRFGRHEKKMNNIHINEKIQWIEKVNFITLFESNLRRSGAFYENILNLYLDRI